ncbi:mechanosensitive ion channel family protein [Candidatus Bipolaricaulota bacterium]|nr:mechanosensitive ion channel family protein [Candidatus Bipolaricaulota bacterium]
MDLLNHLWYGNEVWKWLLAVAVVLFVALFFWVCVRFILRRLSKIAERTSTRLDDLVCKLLERTKLVFLSVAAIYVGSLVVELPGVADQVLRVLSVLALLFQAGYWGNALISFWIDHSIRDRLSSDARKATSLSALGFVAKVVIWSVVVLIGLDNIGVDITALIAGLGVTGIAISLAVQSILGDLFASLSIIIDKPFEIDDFVVVGELSGTVEKIGLKSTRVRSLSGEQIIFGNGDLLSSRIKNYKRMNERRIVFGLGVAYDTPKESLEAIPEMVREIIGRQKDARFDRCHFKTYGEFALLFEIVYYVLIPDYSVYMDVQQAINLDIHAQFEAAGIVFAYPTQTIYLAGTSRSE